MASRRLLQGGALLGAGALAVGLASGTALLADHSSSARPAWINDALPSRQEQLRRLSQGTPANPFDILIIGGAQRGEAIGRAAARATSAGRAAPPGPPSGSGGSSALCPLSAAAATAGGATGTGCAVDAATRCGMAVGWAAGGGQLGGARLLMPRPCTAPTAAAQPPLLNRRAAAACLASAGACARRWWSARTLPRAPAAGRRSWCTAACGTWKRREPVCLPPSWALSADRLLISAAPALPLAACSHPGRVPCAE